MSNPSHTAASHINALARKHYPKRPDKTTIPTKAIPISDAAATIKE